MALNKRSELLRPLTHAEMDSNWTQIENWVAQKAPLNHTHGITQITGLVAALNKKLEISQKGVANGVATLGVDGKVPLSQLPAMGGSTGMFFPHETLTSDDIGKLVILKDGLAQLPVFEPAVSAQNEIVKLSFTNTWAGFQSPATMDIEVLTLPVDGDTFTLTSSFGALGDSNYLTFRFTDTPSEADDIAIAPSISETIDNLIAKVTMGISTVISISKTSPTTFRLTCTNRVGLTSTSGNLSPKPVLLTFSGNFAEDWCNIISTNNDIARLGDAFAGYVLYRSLQLDGEFLAPEVYTSTFFDNETYTNDVYFLGYPEELLSIIPADVDEFKAGISEFIAALPKIISVTWDGNDILIEHEKSSPSTILALSLPVDWLPVDFNFGNLEVLQEGGQSWPSYCKYPIIGQVKSIYANQVEIATAPICKFRLTGTASINWSDIDDFQRYCILNPAEPGYLMSLATSGISGLEDIFLPTKGGYVAAYDQVVNSGSDFWGAFSVDRYPLTVLNAIINSEEGGD